MRTLAAVLVVALLSGGCVARQRGEGVVVGGEAQLDGGLVREPLDAESSISIVEDATNVGAFIPASRDVPVGTEMTWSNDTTTAHTVDFADPSVPDSAELAPGQRHTAAFNTAGGFPYSCRLHPQMAGTINVIAT